MPTVGPHALVLVTEMEDGSTSVCRCPSSWDAEDGAERADAIYNDPLAVWMAYEQYKDRFPDAYYAIWKVECMYDTDHERGVLSGPAAAVAAAQAAKVTAGTS